jgi:hypothetical protein
MTAEKDVRSLCENCSKKEDCCLKASISRPSFFCEEYECGLVGESLVVKTGLESSVRSNYDPAQYVLPPSRRSMGLCATCGSREACCLTKPQGGVWHCEEYC